jgi:hypothetical protein
MNDQPSTPAEPELTTAHEDDAPTSHGTGDAPEDFDGPAASAEPHSEYAEGADNPLDTPAPDDQGDAAEPEPGDTADTAESAEPEGGPQE